MESTVHREIRVDRNLCMGSAQCCWYAPNTFDQDDETVAVVESAGAPLTTAAVSPLTKPERLLVKAGSGEPAGEEAFAAVTVSVALFMVKPWGTGVAPV